MADAWIYVAFAASWIVLVVLCFTRHKEQIEFAYAFTISLLTGPSLVPLAIRLAEYPGEFIIGICWGTVFNCCLVLVTGFDPLGPWSRPAGESGATIESGEYHGERRKRLWPVVVATVVVGSGGMILFPDYFFYKLG